MPHLELCAAALRDMQDMRKRRLAYSWCAMVFATCCSHRSAREMQVHGGEMDHEVIEGTSATTIRVGLPQVEMRRHWYASGCYRDSECCG